MKTKIHTACSRDKDNHRGMRVYPTRSVRGQKGDFVHLKALAPTKAQSDIISGIHKYDENCGCRNCLEIRFIGKYPDSLTRYIEVIKEALANKHGYPTIPDKFIRRSIVGGIYQDIRALIELANKTKEITLICFCADVDKCHRRLLAEWLVSQFPEHFELGQLK